MLSSDSKIVIVGAGVFGLSTALWLARSGYTDITIFDRCAIDETNYDPSRGCDGASADINKIFGPGPGEEKELRALGFEAQEEWLAWNKFIASSRKSDLPAGIEPQSKLFDACGVYWIVHGAKLPAVYSNGVKTLNKEDPAGEKQRFIKGISEEEKQLREVDPVWVQKLRRFDRLNRGDTSGYIDISGGLMIADKACTFARFLCEKAGVKFVLGRTLGNVEQLIVDGRGPEKRVTGIKTHDGLTHMSHLTIVAAGGWTASIMPEAHRTVETTAGTVLFVDVPKERPDIREKYHRDNFPVWNVQSGLGKGTIYSYGFPITSEGRIKMGFRGVRYTNFQKHPITPNLKLSTPRTKYTETPINTVPILGVEVMKTLVKENFPELAEFGFTGSRLCWYTETIDNHFVVDYVPQYSDSLFICSGGSGHGFRFLPVLGKYIKNQIERVPDQFTELWRWRAVEQGQECNGLDQGEFGPREMSSVRLAKPQDFQIDTKIVSRI